MRKILETNLCKINYSDSLENLVKETMPILNQKAMEYKMLFGISNEEKTIVNYFDNLEEFREFIYMLR